MNFGRQTKKLIALSFNIFGQHNQVVSQLELGCVGKPIFKQIINSLLYDKKLVSQDEARDIAQQVKSQIMVTASN